ncbi:RND2 [Lepeophtheirus salmonis]|uniref:RND2 n=1 Tax=Lepeophtheirus salmonis TaxID=72036 RepID=A0A7R8CUA0_LEPSM|nr:RND2 [Lepeophtheirus salmonis]CAF2934326.1 RND2 [Lepeophtheirus salmonis]
MGSFGCESGLIRDEVRVTLVGDSRVGKTALLQRYIHKKFVDGYKSTSFEKCSSSSTVSSRRIKFTIWDTAGLAIRNADVFLLCYKISDSNTLFSAINHWTPEIRAVSTAPIILVGCQSDLRSDRDVLSSLARQGRAPVSSDQALTLGQQIACRMYVETTAKHSFTSASSAFEVAALASLGILKTPRSFTPSPPSTVQKKRLTLESLEGNSQNNDLYFHQSSTPVHFKSPSVGSSSRSASLSSSKTRISSASIPSCGSASSSSNLTCGMSSVLSGNKTPKASRKASSSANKPERVVTLKCQRMTADKTFEEVEIEVPAPIYDTIQLYNETGIHTPRSKEKKSIGSKIKNLFSLA